MTAPRPATIDAERPEDDAIRAFFDRTHRVAFGLALRILGDHDAANQVCEAAYAASCRGGAPSEPESSFLLRVRALALQGRSQPDSRVLRSDQPHPSYVEVSAIRSGLERATPLGRRTVELAYFGGITVGEIAELLGEPLPAVRAALRETLLTLGAAVRQGQENQP